MLEWTGVLGHLDLVKAAARLLGKRAPTEASPMRVNSTCRPTEVCRLTSFKLPEAALPRNEECRQEKAVELK
jgi:hypothetical protein